MKNILDSIMQVEQKLQKNNMDAQKEAEILLHRSQQKLEQLDEEYSKEFYEKRKSMIEEITLEAQKYSDKLMHEMQKKTNIQVENLARKKDKIIKGIHELFIKNKQEG